MSNTLVLSGELLNLAARGTVTSSSASTDFPLANICLRKPSKPFRFNAAAADDLVTLDLNELTNGDFETAALAGWTEDNVGASNDCAAEAVVVDNGSGAVKMTLATAGAGNQAAFYQGVEVPSGEYRTVTAGLRGDGTVFARVRVYIVETGQYLKDDATWTTTPTDLWTRDTASYDTSSLAFQLPAYSSCRLEKLTLRHIGLAAEASNTGDAYIDDFYSWPHWNFVSVHGTGNIGSNITCQIRESTDNFSGSDDLVSAVTIYRPTFWHRETTICTYRYAQIKFVGTNHEAIWIGELVFGQALVLSKTFLFGADETHDMPQIRSGEHLGDLQVFPMADEPQRAWALPWAWNTDAEWEEIRDELWRRSGHGRWPVVIVPRDDKPDVLYADFGPMLQVGYPSRNVRREGTFGFQEKPFHVPVP